MVKLVWCYRLCNKMQWWSRWGPGAQCLGSEVNCKSAPASSMCQSSIINTSLRFTLITRVNKSQGSKVAAPCDHRILGTLRLALSNPAGSISAPPAKVAEGCWMLLLPPPPPWGLRFSVLCL